MNTPPAIQPEGRPVWTTFGQQAALQPQTERLADAAMTRWRDIAAALSPIIGQRGVLALLERCIHLRQIKHPVLAASRAHAEPADAFAVLHAALLEQTPTAAAATDLALRQTFIDLLGRLIGADLTDRLIGFTRP